MFPGFFIGFGRILLEENMLYDEIDVSIGANQDSDPFGLHDITLVLKKDGAQISDMAYLYIGLRHNSRNYLGAYDTYFSGQGDGDTWNMLRLYSDTVDVMEFRVDAYTDADEEVSTDRYLYLVRVVSGTITLKLRTKFYTGNFQHDIYILYLLPSGELGMHSFPITIQGQAVAPP